MSGEAQSATALRCLIRAFVSTSPGNGEDLQNINTANLPDGAQCFVTSTRQLFRFRKFSTIAAVADTVIVPSSGGGRWVLESGAPSGALPLYVHATNTNEVETSSSDDWIASSTALYSMVFGDGAWTFSASTCLLTYDGPPATYMFDLRATFTNEDQATVQLGVSVENDLAGTANGFAEGIQFTELAGANPTQTETLSSQRVVTLAPGAIVQPRYRVGGSEVNLIIERMTLTAIAVQ